MFTPAKIKKYVNEFERFIEGRKVNLSIIDVDFDQTVRHWAITDETKDDCKHRITVERKYCGFSITLYVDFWANSIEVHLVRRNYVGNIFDGKAKSTHIWEDVSFYPWEDKEQYEQLANRAMELIVCLMR